MYDLQFINYLDKLKEVLFDKCKANKIEVIYLDKQNDKLFKQNKEKIKEQNKEIKEELKEKEEQFKKDLKNLLDSNLIEYLKNINLNENDRYYLEDNLTEEQLNFVYKIINDNFYYSIIFDLVNIFNKQYKKYNKYKSINNTNYYLEFEDILDSYLETNNKVSFDNDIEAKLYSKYNKQSWSKNKDILTLLKEEKQEYATIRLFLDSRRTQKLSDKLIKNLYKELNKNNKKEPSKKTLYRFRKKIEAIYNINSDNIITSLKY